MSTLGGNIRTVLIGDAGVAAIVQDKVFQNRVPMPDERSGWPKAAYIWFRRSGAEDHDCLNDVQGAKPWREFFDMECCSTDVGEELELAAAVRAALHNVRGAFGDQRIAGCQVVDHSDDYLPRNLEADEGLNVAALSIRIFTGD